MPKELCVLKLGTKFLLKISRGMDILCSQVTGWVLLRGTLSKNGTWKRLSARWEKGLSVCKVHGRDPPSTLRFTELFLAAMTSSA